MGIYIDKIQFSTNFWSGYPSQSIQFLQLRGKFSYINLDNFVNLTSLCLDGTLEESFNFDIFKNLCNQLESLRILLTDIESNRLFDGYHFPYLKQLSLSRCFIERVDKIFINRFPMLIRLNINSCRLETIEDEAFSNLNQLRYLGLPGNQIRFIGKNSFLNLKNLKVLDLTNNGLTHINPEFIGLENSVEIRLEDTYYYF